MWNNRRTQRFDTQDDHIFQSTLTVIWMESLEGLHRRDTGHVTRTGKKEDVQKFWLENQKTKVKFFLSPPFCLMVEQRCCFFRQLQHQVEVNGQFCDSAAFTPRGKGSRYVSSTSLGRPRGKCEHSGEHKVMLKLVCGTCGVTILETRYSTFFLLCCFCYVRCC